MSGPLAAGPGYCIGCARPSDSWACPACRSSLDHVVAMLHAPRGELVATWLSIMTTDARLERDPEARLELDRDGASAPASPGALAQDAEPVASEPVALEAVAAGALASGAVASGAVASEIGTSEAMTSEAAASEAAASEAAASEAAASRAAAGEELSAEAGQARRETLDPVTDRLVALGLVIERSGMLRQRVQDAFGLLAGGEFGAAVAAGQPVGWLIDNCEVLADAHRDLQDAGRKAIIEALHSCRAANERRVDLEHGVQAGSRTPDSDPKTIENFSGPWRSAEPPWPIPDIRDVSDALEQAGLLLLSAVEEALQPEA